MRDLISMKGNLNLSRESHNIRSNTAGWVKRNSNEIKKDRGRRYPILWEAYFASTRCSRGYLRGYVAYPMSCGGQPRDMWVFCSSQTSLLPTINPGGMGGLADLGGVPDPWTSIRSADYYKTGASSDCATMPRQRYSIYNVKQQNNNNGSVTQQPTTR